jgi:hypothetical protein
VLVLLKPRGDSPEESMKPPDELGPTSVGQIDGKSWSGARIGIPPRRWTDQADLRHPSILRLLLHGQHIRPQHLTRLSKELWLLVHPATPSPPSPALRRPLHPRPLWRHRRSRCRPPPTRSRPRHRPRYFLQHSCYRLLLTLAAFFAPATLSRCRRHPQHRCHFPRL